MGNWGDEFDEELQDKKEIKVGIMFSFKSMNHVLGRIADETREWDDKHPKQELMKIWTNVMVIFLVLFSLSYSVLALATGFFYFFYLYIIIQIFGVWKQFHYSKAAYWLMTVGALAINFAIAWFIRGVIFG